MSRFFIYFLFLSDEGPMLETLDFTIRIGSTPTFSYFDLIYITWLCLLVLEIYLLTLGIFFYCLVLGVNI